MIVAQPNDLTFNFAAVLPGRASSRHTMRAYFRWVDAYLVDNAGLTPTTAESRVMRMSALPVRLLNETLSPAQLRAWLGLLATGGHGKQGLDQARAAVVTLADLLGEAGLFDALTAAAMSRVRPPRAEAGQRSGRWLSIDELKLLMESGREIATTDTQRFRNDVLITILCTMALRREEVSNARWDDLSLQNNRVVMRIHGKGRKVAVIDVPRPVLRALDRWQKLAVPDDPRGGSPLLRRIWKGGRVSRQGLTADGVWWIVNDAARHAGLGHIAPHDLRRSVAGALHEAGTPVDKISRLLRHSNIAVTERYLNRLPHRNEGALVMSDMLGLDDDWPGYD